MSNLPPDARAFRQEIYVSLIAFVIGFVVLLSALAWVIVRFVYPEAPWWELAHTSINAVLISIVIGGLGSAALSMSLLSKYHYRGGVYHCLFCGRTLSSARDRCPCRPHG